MKLFSKVQSKVAPRVTLLPSVEPRYPTFNYANVVKDAYEKNELVYTCIQRIHKAFVESPIVTFDENDVVLPKSRVQKLFEKPNRFMSYYEFMELSFIYFILSGNLFWEKVRNSNGTIIELWPLRPDQIKIIPDAKKLVAGYVYQVGGKDYPIKVDDMIHFKWGNAEDSLFGMSPLKSAFRQIDTDNEATDMTKVVFENSAFPFVVINTQEEIDAAKAKRLTARWMDKFGGKKRGRPAFLQQGMEVQTLDIDLSKLLFPDLRGITETRILMTLGVPPIIAGSKTGLDSSTYSNAPAFREFFFEQTIAPMHQLFVQKFLIDLAPDFVSGSERIGYDTKQSSFLRKIYHEQVEQANKLVIGGWVKVNEGRKMIGLPPDPKQDGYLRPMSSIFVPADGSDAKPPLPLTTPVRAPRDNRLAGAPKKSSQLLGSMMYRLEMASNFSKMFSDAMLDAGGTEFPMEKAAVLMPVAEELFKQAVELTFESVGQKLDPVHLMEQSARVRSYCMELARVLSDLTPKKAIIRVSNAGAMFAFEQMGVQEYEWVSTHPECHHLDGSTYAVSGPHPIKTADCTCTMIPAIQELTHA